MTVSSSVGNARDLDALIKKYSLAGNFRATIENQLVDGALSIFHKLEKMPDRLAARGILHNFHRQGSFSGFCGSMHKLRPSTDGLPATGC